jgi:hypothetical protein
MLNLIRVTLGVRKNQFLIVCFAVGLCLVGTFLAVKQRHVPGGTKPYCLKGYICKMMSRNLTR